MISHSHDEWLTRHRLMWLSQKKLVAKASNGRKLVRNRNVMPASATIPCPVRPHSKRRKRAYP